MNLGNLAEHGRSRSSTSWLTNPVRRILWWLIAPFFRGAEAQITGRLDVVEAGVMARLPEITAEAETRVAAKVESRLGGLSKDASAVAHRIAGLEEEAAQFSGRIQGVEHEAQSAAQAVNERFSQLEQALEEVREQASRIRSQARDNGVVVAEGPTGERFLLRRHDHIGSRMIAGEEWEPHVRHAIEKSARPNGIAVDAGAYIGIHTMTMSRCFSSVHAFEPQRAVFQVLCGNLALNERTNVITHNAALYDRSTAMKLAPQDHQEVDVPMIHGEIDYNRLQNAAALSFEVAGSDDKQVDANALDDLALENIALIKVDTQGSDLRVLSGAERTIARWKPVVLFEWERDLGAMHGATLDGFFAFFEKLDYDVEILHETSPGRQADYIARPRDGAREKISG